MTEKGKEEMEEKTIEQTEDIDKKKDNNKKRKLKKKNIIFIAIVSLIVIAFIIFSIVNKKYTVKFDTSGGVKIASQKVKSKEKVIKPSDPTKKGHTFAGWYLDDEEYDFESEVASNITLEAKWISDESEEVTGVTLDQIELAILPGDTIPLFAVVEPSDANNKSVIFRSSDEEVATVDSRGNVTGVKIGVATITVITLDGGHTDTCKIVVSNDVIKATGIVLSDTDVTLGVNESKKVTATIAPDNATNKGVLWESNDEEIASVSATGTITANKKGTTVITATTKDGGYRETVNVTVDEIEPGSITLNRTSITIAIDEEFTLEATIAPKNSAYKEVTWKSENEDVVKVDKNGKIVGKKEGVTDIIVTTKKGDKTTKCTVTVKKPVAVSDIKLDKTSLSLKVGDKDTLIATVLPSNAVNQAIKWKSSDTNIATINNGVVTAVGSGEAIITVTTLDGEKTATCKVVVSGEVKNYTYRLEKKEEEDEEGNTTTFYVLTIYENGKNITDRVSNINISATLENGNYILEKDISEDIRFTLDGIFYTAKKR